MCEGVRVCVCLCGRVEGVKVCVCVSVCESVCVCVCVCMGGCKSQKPLQVFHAREARMRP